jgi:excisionase family DNA binding protein
MEKLFAPAFRRFVKKQYLPMQLAIQDEVDSISVNPEIGKEKKGNLTGFRVHKFRFHQQEYLIAYDEVFDDIPSTFTIKETSEYLEVAEITIRRWVKEGKLPYDKVGKNSQLNTKPRHFSYWMSLEGKILEDFTP